MDIAAIIQLISVLAQLVPNIQKIISDLHQSGEMTPEQKATLDKAINGTVLDPAWQPDKS